VNNTLVAKAEHVKRETKLQADTQKLELDKTVEEQRRSFHEQLAEQHRELEKQAEAQKREMEKSMQEQIMKAIQDHMNRFPPPPPPDFHQMFVNQGRQIQLLTRLMMKQLSHQDTSPCASASTGKRTADGINAADDDVENSFCEMSEPLDSPDLRKRADLKSTKKTSKPKHFRREFKVVAPHRDTVISTKP
jgi:hypothetical protein